LKHRIESETIHRSTYAQAAINKDANIQDASGTSNTISSTTN